MTHIRVMSKQMVALSRFHSQDGIVKVESGHYHPADKHRIMTINVVEGKILKYFFLDYKWRVSFL